ncbi:MAG: cysteine desulfurase family protein [Candidatus Cloacimonetes bacterium]|nr:cysteine desulfurase family protein [Candidatus Cloacimonadota bacterium]
MKPIYLDYNASTPVLPEIAEAMLPFLTSEFGNPSSSHYYGMENLLAIEDARFKLAELIDCDPGEIIFTSGGTESNNMAIKGLAYAKIKTGNHIITSAIEHPAVLEVCKFLETRGFEVTYVPVDKEGVIKIDLLERAIRPSTILISIMHSNNEVGTLQPIAEIAEIAIKNHICFHTDAAQSIGKVEIDVQKLKVDMMSIAGHKFYAPKGVGALYVKNGIELEKFMHGASHEMGRRAGTENVLEIVGLGKAAEYVKKNHSELINKYRVTSEIILSEVMKSDIEVLCNGHPEKRLPNTLSLSFNNIVADRLVGKLPELAISTGAACHAAEIQISHVLKAMGVPDEYAKGTIRVTTGALTTETEAKTAAKIIIDALRDLQRRTT